MARLMMRSGKGSVRIDQADKGLLECYPWYLRKQGNTHYAYAKAGGRLVAMHRLILGVADDEAVDHINGDGTDNRRSNLRIATTKQNIRNQRKRRGRSQFKGVCPADRAGVWRAQIRVDYKQIYLGEFSSEEEAARAYDEAARIYFDEFARLNFPGGAR